MKKTNATIGVLAGVLTLSIAVVAFAHGGGYGRHMGGYGGHMMGPGYMMGPGGYQGGHMRGYGPGYGPHMRGYGAWSDLSDEDAAKLETAREKFFNQTRELRNQIDEKQFALRSETRKDNPDEGKVIRLQKELSGLRAEFDEKAVAHQLEMRKLLPENFQGRTFGRGGRGYGGYCW